MRSEAVIMTQKKSTQLRSQQWFDNPNNPGMTALYLERYQNQGYTREELQSGRPMIGISQTGSARSPKMPTVSSGPRIQDSTSASP